MPKIAVTAAGTDIGKTYISCLLLKYWSSQGLLVQPLKPVVSGWIDGESDTEHLLTAADIEINTESIHRCSPWRFTAPLAPHLAAEQEKRAIPWDDIASYGWKQAHGTPYYTLLEGVGGVMSPISQTHHMLDWLEGLQWPTLLIGGSYLGAMSHLLTALTALESSDIPVIGCIINQSPKDQCIGLDTTIASIENFTDKPIWGVPLGASAANITPVLKEITERIEHYGG